jgi:hypothetical protein
VLKVNVALTHIASRITKDQDYRRVQKNKQCGLIQIQVGRITMTVWPIGEALGRAGRSGLIEWHDPKSVRF